MKSIIIVYEPVEGGSEWLGFSTARATWLQNSIGKRAARIHLGDL